MDNGLYQVSERRKAAAKALLIGRFSWWTHSLLTWNEANYVCVCVRVHVRKRGSGLCLADMQICLNELYFSILTYILIITDCANAVSAAIIEFLAPIKAHSCLSLNTFMYSQKGAIPLETVRGKFG